MNFIINDKSLIDRNLCERCLMHKIAEHLQIVINEKINGYYVDCEFNRIENNPKSFNRTENNRKNSDRKRIFTDIIIHGRDDNKENNKICIELKKKATNGKSADLERLKKLTDRSESFAYNIGYFIELPANRKKQNGLEYIVSEPENKEQYGNVYIVNIIPKR